MGRTWIGWTALAALALAAGPAWAQGGENGGERAPDAEEAREKSPDPRWVPADAEDVEPTPQAIECARAEPDGVPYEFSTDARVVALTGPYGRLDRFTQLLQQVDLIDESERWIAGEDHLVFMGGLFGHGGQNLECLYLLKDLADQAEVAGGKVHFVLGTNDFLNLRGILSTMPSTAYEHLAEDDSQARADERLERWLEELWEYNSGYPEEQRLRLRRNFERFYKTAHQPGAMEFLDLLAPGTEYGEWMRRANTVVQINGLLFVAGGIHPIYADISLAKINAYHRDEFNETSVYVPIMSDHRFAPYMWPGLSTMPTHVSHEQMNEILAGYGAPMMVVAHAPGQQPESMVKNRVVHVESNLIAPREQGAFNAVEFEGDAIRLNNAGRVRELTVPPVPETG